MEPTLFRQLRNRNHYTLVNRWDNFVGRKSIAYLWLTVILFLVACTTSSVDPATPLSTETPLPPLAPTATFTLRPTITASPITQPPTATPTPFPTNTVLPSRTPVPGFAGWSFVNSQAVTVAAAENALLLTLQQRALWFMTERGVLFYQPVTGNFKITATVFTSKSSDPAQPPGGDGTVQLGGIMARHGDSRQENYVFVVVGSDSGGLVVETKTTQGGVSEWEGADWPAAAAALRLCRVDETFNLYKRPVEGEEEWVLAAAFARPDLPDTLQVGINIYSDSEPDLQVRYEGVRVEMVTDETDCTQD